MQKNDDILKKLTPEQLEKLKNEKIMSMLGFAAKAGKLACGADKVCDEIRRHGVPDLDETGKVHGIGIVIIASDASANTKKRIINACTYYNIGYTVSKISSDGLSARLGKMSATAVCATFDRGFADGIEKAVNLGSDTRHSV